MIKEYVSLKNKIGVGKINAALSVFDQGLASGANLILPLIIARTLSEEIFGIFVLLYSFWLFVYFLQVGFINQSLYVLFYSEGSDYKETIPTIQFIFSFIVSLLVFVIVQGFHQWLKVDIVVSLYFSGSVFVLLLREFIRNYHIASLNIEKTIFYDALFLITLGISAYLFYVTDSFDLNTVWIINIISGSIIVLCDIAHTKHKLIWDVVKLKKNCILNYKFSKWNILTNLLIWANGNIFKYVVNFYFGIKVLASIGACQYVIFIFNPIINGIQNYLISFLSKEKYNNPEQFRNKQKKSFIFFVSLILCLSMLMILFTKDILRLLYAEKFVDYSYILLAMLISISISVFNRLYNIIFLINKKTKAMFKVYFSSVSITILLLILFVKNYGIKGFVLYLVLQNFVTLILHAINYKYEQRKGMT